jgi:hypothetical protein
VGCTIVIYLIITTTFLVDKAVMKFTRLVSDNIIIREWILVLRHGQNIVEAQPTVLT